MRWFRSRQPGPGPESVPPWAAFFSPGNYALFLRHVRASLESQRLIYEIGDGEVMVYEPVETIMGLSNLAQHCNSAKPATWRHLIDHHVYVMLTALTEHVPPSRDGAEASIRLRAMDVDIATAYGLVSRPAFPGLVGALFIDRPDAVQSVTPDMVVAWDIPLDDLFALAESNTRNLEMCERERTQLASGVELHTLHGPSLFTATHALWPQAWLGDLIGATAADPNRSNSNRSNTNNDVNVHVSSHQHGVLLACPTRHLVVAHVVQDLAVLQAIPAIRTIAAQHHETGPGSLLETIWWWRNGTAHVVPAELRDGDHQPGLAPVNDQLTTWFNQLASGEPS
jgi:hypothetical protein